jgi:hypothetical protein
VRRGTHGGHVGLLGWETNPDRWIGPGNFYPNIPSARMDIGYFGGVGTLWDYVSQFSLRSDRAVAHVDRDALEWRFQPLVPNPLYGLLVQCQYSQIGPGHYRNLFVIRLYVTNGPLLFDYRSRAANEYHVPTPNGEQPNNLVQGFQWQGDPNPFPPPTNFPDCPYQVIPVRWFEYGHHEPSSPPQVYDAFVKY